jgi:transcriptional regulator with PAS, ATPase and Fis domain
VERSPTPTRITIGLFVEARGGSLFLDEIGELPLSLQAKLLRAIGYKEVRPMGAVRGEKVDVRILAATSRDLRRAVADGNFREDLFYRLNIVEIHLPSCASDRKICPS